MTKFTKGKFVLVEAPHESVFGAYGFRQIGIRGVYQLTYNLCCDNFKTCNHAGKSVCVNGCYYSIANVLDSAVFDSYDSARMAGTLAGVL